MKRVLKSKIIVFLMIIIGTFLITSCELDIEEINQPENGYTNSKVITTIRADLNSASGEGFYSLSILLPTAWEIENNQVNFKLSSSEQTYAIDYNSENTTTITTDQTPPAGYSWWSGKSSVELTSQNLKAVAHVVFNTGSTTGDYDLRYCIGDSYDNNLSEYSSELLPITITAQPQSAVLHNGTVFPESDSYSWDNHAFEVAYNSSSRTIPSTKELYLNGVAYDLELLAGSAHNGKYGLDLADMGPGAYYYYYLFDNSLRYPAGTENLELTINDDQLHTFPLTESFETTSETLDAWEMDGDWQIGQAMEATGDPATAYDGSILAGTNIDAGGMTTANTVSYLKSPIFDAREELDITLDFYHYSTFSTGSQLDISLEIFQENREASVKTLSNNTAGWELETLDISSDAAGKIFRVVFIFTSGTTPCAGSSIDLVSIQANQFSDVKMTFADTTLAGEKGDDVEFLFYLDNIGTGADNYDFTVSGTPEYSYQLQQADENDNWSNISFNNLTLGFSESAMLKLIATIPLNTDIESEEIELVLNSDNGVTKSQTLKTMVRSKVLGTDNYGYVMYSSDYSDLADFDWITLLNPTVLTENDLSSYVNIELDFMFPYYYNNYYSLYLTPFGGIAFEEPAGEDQVVSIPAENDDNSLLGLYWDELSFAEEREGAVGTVYYEQITLNEQPAFVITYDQCYTYNNREESFTAQMILFADGRIKFQYLDIPRNFFQSYPIVGIEDYSGTDGISFQAGYNALKSNYALLFSTELVAKSLQPAMYASATTSTDLSWNTIGDFSSMKVYLKEDSDSFDENDLVYNGTSINLIANSQLPQLSIGSAYYWKVVGVTSEGYEVATKVYEFYPQNSYVASGTVTDNYSHAPIAGVLVRTMDELGPMKSKKSTKATKSTDTRISVLTDENGYWSMDLASNGYYFEFTKDGYETASFVYLGVWEGEDNTLNIELNNQGASDPTPSSDARNISTSPALSWTNPAGYNHTKIEIATKENMADAQVLYNGVLIDSYSSIPTLENSTFYYWQVTLSVDGTSNFAQSDVWRFLTEFPESVPNPDYSQETTDYSVRKATKASSGYLLPGGDFGAAQQIIKTDEAGNIVWQNSYSTARSSFVKAIEMPNGHYLVIRDEYTSYISGERSGVSEVTSSGDVEWSHSYKYEEGNYYSNEDTADGILDSSGKVVMCGGTGFRDWDFLLTKASLDSYDPIWQNAYGIDGAQEKAHSVVQSSSGGYIMAGYRAGTTTNDIGNSRVLVIKTNSSGTQQWVYEEDSVNPTDDITSTGYKAVETADGSIIVVGSAYNSYTEFVNNYTIVIKLSASGQELWKRYYPLQFYGVAKDVAVDDEGNIYLTGNPDAMKLDSEGNILWYYNDNDDSIGNDFTTILLTDNGFTIAGGKKIIIFGDNVVELTIPENIVVTIDGNDVTLSWDSVSGASSYDIESATEPNGSYSFEATTSTNSWSGTITGNRKFFKIKAKN